MVLLKNLPLLALPIVLNAFAAKFNVCETPQLTNFCEAPQLTNFCEIPQETNLCKTPNVSETEANAYDLLENKGETPWIFKKEAQNVKVYYRESPDGGVKEVKMITDFETTPSAIVALVEDFDGYQTWVYRSKESRLIKRYTDFEVDYYNALDFPWPLSDRDVAVHSKITQDPKTKTLTSISTCNPTAVPKIADAVRITLFNSKWVFTQTGTGKLHSEYQFRSHPGGSIPSWMVNLALDEGPLNTIAGMRRALKNPKYKNAKIEGIVD